MTYSYADWQVTELARLCRNDRERAERALNALWAAMPGLYEELALAAGVPCVEETPLREFAVVESGVNAAARLATSGVAVWEVIRVHRRSNSMDELRAAFPAVEASDLQAALDYALVHREEIDLLIKRYESMVEHKRTQYPYAR